MLVLSRGEKEQIMIGREILLEVIEIRGDKVRLGFTADPEKYAIHRREIYDRIERGEQREEVAP